MSILKTILTDVVDFAKANEATVIGWVTPILDKLATEGVAEAQKLVAEIPNDLVKSVLNGLISEYGPQLPALIAKYEGTAFDKLIAFLQAEIAKLQ